MRVDSLDIRALRVILFKLLRRDKTHPTVEITIDNQPLQLCNCVPVSHKYLGRDWQDLIEGDHSKPSRCALTISLRTVLAPA